MVGAVAAKFKLPYLERGQIQREPELLPKYSQELQPQPSPRISICGVPRLWDNSRRRLCHWNWYEDQFNSTLGLRSLDLPTHCDSQHRSLPRCARPSQLALSWRIYKSPFWPSPSKCGRGLQIAEQ